MASVHYNYLSETGACMLSESDKQSHIENIFRPSAMRRLQDVVNLRSVLCMLSESHSHESVGHIVYAIQSKL